MNILILNWRDIHNPKAGGAEQLTHEMARRWVDSGHRVTLFTAAYKGALPEEMLHGITIVRRGNWWSVYPLACLYYFLRFRFSTDVIIDEVHWFPFFARLYAPRKTILLACEVATKLFDELFPSPIATIGKIVESFYLRIYSRCPTLAISKSTKKALVSRGFPSESVTVLPMGVTMPVGLKQHKKEKDPTIIFLGRLSHVKGADDALKAFVLIKKKIPNVQLWMVGSGKLDGTGQSAIFHGFVSEKKKFELLSRAHVLIVPSVHEGWGLVVSEAGLVKTPAVVYDVPGLHDVVHHNQSGFVVYPLPERLAEEVIRLLTDHLLYKKLSTGAYTTAKNSSWDKTAEVAINAIVNYTS